MVFDPSEFEGPKFDCIYIVVADVIIHRGGDTITLLNSATFLWLFHRTNQDYGCQSVCYNIPDAYP